MSLRTRLIVVSILMLSAPSHLVACSATPPTDEVGGTSNIVVVQDTTYLQVDEDGLIDDADAIFLGKVTAISPSRWNQNSGEMWDDGLQLHTFDVQILRPFMGEFGPGDSVTITQLGPSPLEGTADHDLAVGQQALFFVGETELAWREGGTHPIMGLIGDPMDSYYRQHEDGLYYRGSSGEPLDLNTLITQIDARQAAAP